MSADAVRTLTPRWRNAHRHGRCKLNLQRLLPKRFDRPQRACQQSPKQRTALKKTRRSRRLRESNPRPPSFAIGSTLEPESTDPGLAQTFRKKTYGMSTDKKVVVVTGASRGIGAGVVTAFRRLDYRAVAVSCSIWPTSSRSSSDEAVACDVAYALNQGDPIPETTYRMGEATFGREGMAEVGTFHLVAVILNGYDVSVPGREEGLDRKHTGLKAWKPPNEEHHSVLNRQASRRSCWSIRRYGT